MSQTSNARIHSTTVEGFLSGVGLVISFNRNPDHVRYARFYRKLIDSRCDRVVTKVALITTVGLKEFCVGLFYLFLGWKVFHIVHDFVPHPGRKFFITLFYNTVASFFFRLVFHSRSQAERFAKECHIFPLPVTRLPASQHSSTCSLLAFGRCQAYKNFDHIVHLANVFKEYSFIIASNRYSPPSRPSNLTIIDSFMTDDDLDALIMSCMAVVLPYTSATQSGVIIQSFELGRPVIVSEQPGLIEYLCGGSWAGCSFSLFDDSSFRQSVERVRLSREIDFRSELQLWNSSVIL